eukprot:scaffold38606_cov63-Phaeocystis_antarctica.AAC.2
MALRLSSSIGWPRRSISYRRRSFSASSCSMRSSTRRRFSSSNSLRSSSRRFVSSRLAWSCSVASSRLFSSSLTAAQVYLHGVCDGIAEDLHTDRTQLDSKVVVAESDHEEAANGDEDYQRRLVREGQAVGPVDDCIPEGHEWDEEFPIVCEAGEVRVHQESSDHAANQENGHAKRYHGRHNPRCRRGQRHPNQVHEKNGRDETLPRVGLAIELRCERRLVRGVFKGASDGVRRRCLEVRVVLAPRRGAGEERPHTAKDVIAITETVSAKFRLSV